MLHNWFSPSVAIWGENGDNVGKKSKQPSDESSNQQAGNQQMNINRVHTLLEDDDNDDNNEQLPSTLLFLGTF